MSKLLNMLAQLNRPPENGEVPPGIRIEIARATEKARARHRYLLCGAIGLGAVLVGIGLRLSFDRIDQPLHVNRSLPPRVTPIAPETGQPVAETATAGGTAQLPGDSPPTARHRHDQPARTVAKRSKRTLHPTPDAAMEIVATPSPAATVPIVPPPPRIDKEARDANLTAARSAEKRKAYSEALRLYQQALSHDQTNHALMNNAASVYLRLGDHAAALAMTDKTLQWAPDYVPALINQGIARNHLSNTAGAAESFARALEVEPSNRDALFNLALFNEKNGKLDLAATVFQRLAVSGDLQGMFGLARIYEKRLQQSEAIRVYSEIMAVRDLPAALRNSAAERLRQLRN